MCFNHDAIFSPKLPRRKINQTIVTEVIAQLPLKVDLSKLNSGNDLRFTVKSGGGDA